MDQENINLHLTAEEINLLLEGLGNMPFVKVYALIARIQQQASVQISKDTGTSEPPK